MSNSSVNDCALGSFCSLYRTNFDILQSEECSVFNVLVESLPIEDIEEVTGTVYALFLDMFERNQQLVNPENFGSFVSILTQISESKVVSNDVIQKVYSSFRKIMQCGLGQALKE